MNISTSVMYVI